MAYGQINYPQSLGTGPTIASIADVGCFLVAFCNLLERFGETVDPPTLNNYFVGHNSYMVDGADRDILGWGSVSAYDGNVVVSQLGNGGWPQSNEAIVKFIYKSQRTGASITHFCLVADHASRQIVDSYDGHTKVSPYGDPVAWAVYEKHGGQIVTPPPAPEEASFSVENIPEATFEVEAATHKWDLNQRSWPAMVNNPVGNANPGDRFTCGRIAHHVLGGSYYMPDGDASQGYNVVDCKEVVPVAPTPPAPLPTGGLQSGNPDAKYELIKVVPGYRTATDAGNHTNQVNEVQPGSYFIFNTHPNNSDLVNVTSVLGKPGSWINKADNVETPPPAPEPAAPPVPEPPAAQISTAPVDSTTPVGWRDTFAIFPKPVHYIATRDITVEDKSGQQPDVRLYRYDPGVSDTEGVVSAFGTFVKEGVEYYRLKTNNDPEFNYWYGIPKVDPNTRTPNLLVMPAPGGALGKMTVAHDTLQLAKSRFETDLPKFLETIPKFLRNKNKK